jgi:hypothetical protein
MTARIPAALMAAAAVLTVIWLTTTVRHDGLALLILLTVAASWATARKKVRA